MKEKTMITDLTITLWCFVAIVLGVVLIITMPNIPMRDLPDSELLQWLAAVLLIGFAFVGLLAVGIKRDARLRKPKIGNPRRNRRNRHEIQTCSWNM